MIDNSTFRDGLCLGSSSDSDEPMGDVALTFLDVLLALKFVLNDLASYLLPSLTPGNVKGKGGVPRLPAISSIQILSCQVDVALCLFMQHSAAARVVLSESQLLKQFFSTVSEAVDALTATTNNSSSSSTEQKLGTDISHSLKTLKTRKYGHRGPPPSSEKSSMAQSTPIPRQISKDQWYYFFKNIYLNFIF